MDKIRNLSVRKSIIFYLSVSLLCSFLLSALVVKCAAQAQRNIWWKYTDKDRYIERINQYFEMPMDEREFFQTDISRPPAGEMTQTDLVVSETCDFLQTYSVLILSVLGSCIAVFLFYRNKLKRPIEELELASKNIAGNNLDFQISYENKDEMGSLCHEFERMRRQLAENNQRLWRMIEEEKALRAAIAHDIRTPLSVLRGYQEMLLEFVTEGSLNKEQILSMLSEGMGQIERMNGFVETMRRMSSLEDRGVQAERMDLLAFAAQVEQETVFLSKEAEKRYEIQTDFQKADFIGDRELILEVVENLLSNALRYARETVKITLIQKENELTVTVADDGPGFLDGPQEVTKAFYHSNPQGDFGHFGLGMYICKLYCEKHGGRLLPGNGQGAGAVVKAVFCSLE